MDDLNLLNLNPETVVIVPTSSLARDLVERHAKAKIDQGLTVWQSPRILVWKEFVCALWAKNAKQFAQQSWMNPVQANSIWTSVIEASKHKDQGLLLLNTQQTVRAVTRSWALSHDWSISFADLANSHGEDSSQLLAWFEGFRQRLKQHAWVDRCLAEQLMASARLECDFGNVVFYAYDLLTTSQKALNNNLEIQGIEIQHKRPKVACDSEIRQRFDHPDLELQHALIQCRNLIEQDPNTRISLVIPDLQNRFHDVHRMAQQVFYPNTSPLELLAKPLVYRFSLGEAMYDLPAIRVALALIDLMLASVSKEDLAFILRSRFIGLLRHEQAFVSNLAQRVQAMRKSRLSLAELNDLVRELDDQSSTAELFVSLDNFVNDVQQRLEQEQQRNAYKVLSVAEWLGLISAWLDKWQWSTSLEPTQPTANEVNLEKSWVGLLETLASLNLVQSSLGAGRLRSILHQQCRETIFLPKSPASPLVISGVLEAIGRPVDTLFLLSADQQFPQPPRRDAFISNSLLAKSQHPQALPESDFEHQSKVIANLLLGAKNRIVSYSHYAADDLGVRLLPSRLFGSEDWQDTTLGQESTSLPQLLETFVDDSVPPLVDTRQLRGGARIFENQAQCPFKSFASHRLMLTADDESEFGLDPLDKGNAVHLLLERLWQQVGSQSKLLTMSNEHLNGLIDAEIERLLQENSLELNTELHTLLRHERYRLNVLIKEWLELEKTRPLNFEVVERESKGSAQIAGISYRYVIDRIDRLDDGRYVLIDYKTGLQSRSGLVSERLESPQLPLYREAFEQKNATPVSGVAFGQVKRGAQDYVELAEDGVFRKSSGHTLKRAEQWAEASQAWRQQCQDLAEEFLSGRADVTPLDTKKCDYCEFSSLCRIAESTTNLGVDDD